MAFRRARRGRGFRSFRRGRRRSFGARRMSRPRRRVFIVGQRM